MAKQKTNRYVVKHPGGWAVKSSGTSRASSVHATQKEAVRRAKEIAYNQGGGEVVIHGRDGRIRESITYGRDTLPPKGAVYDVKIKKNKRDGRDSHVIKGTVHDRGPSPRKGGKREKDGKSVTKIRKIGSSQGVILNREVLESAGLKEGDRVFVLSTPDGVKLTPYDPAFVEVIESTRDYMRRHRNALRELAK